MPMSDDEVKSFLFNNSSTPATKPQGGISDEEVKRVLFAPSQSENQQAPLDVPKTEQSPLSLQERISLGAVNDRDREKYFRSKFGYVQRLPNGKYAVGNSIKDAMPVDPEGIFNDTLGDLADVASEIPVIAGQIAGTIAGAPGGPVGSIAGAALGSGAGEAVRAGLSKLSGIDKRSPQEIATDMAISSAFGAAGEGLAQGTVAAGKVLAPKISNFMRKASIDQAEKSGISPDQTPIANATKKIFNVLANVPETSTETFFKYGMQEMSNPVHFKKSSILSIVDDTVKALNETNKRLGQEVGNQTNKLVGLAKNQYIPVDDLFTVIREDARRLGVLDETYKVNKLYPNTADIKPMTNMLRELGEVKDGAFIPQAGKRISVEKAVQMSKSFGQKFDKVSGDVQNSLFKVLNGDDSLKIKGIRPRITDVADSIGLKEYAQSNEKYASLLKLRDQLGQLDTKNPSKIEALINRLENIGETTKRDLKAVDNQIGGNLLKRWELFNAAQDFNKTNFNVLRFGSIAATLGVLTGFNTKEDKAATLIGAGLLGTPAGLKTIIRSGRRFVKPFSSTNQAIRNVNTSANKQTINNTGKAILSRLIQNRAESPKGQQKQ